MPEPSVTHAHFAGEDAARNSAFSNFAVAALSFGLIAGIVEGAGLMFFQRVNWERWGPMIHVSWKILWISPVVDVCFFSVLGALFWIVGQLISRERTFRVVVFVFSFLCVYDWLTVTGRLYRLACIVFALGAGVAVTRWFSHHERKTLPLLRKAALCSGAVFTCLFIGIEAGAAWSEQHAVAKLPAATNGNPNVVVIVMDTLRADHVSSYGYSRQTTSNLDRLAREGVRFDNAIAPSSWSLPSHVSLVTGRYLHDHKVGNVQPEPWSGWGQSSLGGLPTIGEELEKRGYRTGAFSANRTYFSSNLGFGRGFLHFEDYFNSPADCFVRTLYGREFARVYLKRSEKSLVKRILRRLGWTSLLDQDAEGSGSYGGAFGVRKHADQVNAELLSWINRDNKRPFFAFLNYFDVHDPYGGPRSYPKPDWPQTSTVDFYDDGVKYADDNIGRLMESLRQRGLADKTLVIVTSDHGESLGQHFLMTHGRALYWELIHVPLVLWYPGHLPSGITVQAPVTNAAIPATIMDVVSGDESSFPGPGADKFWNTPAMMKPPSPLAELAQNKYPGKHDAQADQRIPTATTGSMQSLVTDRWQLIMHQSKGTQLYDWNKDPQELNNQTLSPEGGPETDRLEQELRRQLPH